jgi:hypothetical protein
MIVCDQTFDLVSQNDLCLFLYAKGIKSEIIRDDRIRDFERILHAENILHVPLKIKRNLIMAKERLIRIVQDGEESYDFTEESENAFTKFVRKHPEWNSENSFVVFRDHPNLSSKKHSYVERFQKSGLCFMHAPVVLQHYLVSMHSDQHMPMLDIAAYLRQFMDPIALEKHIWNDEGGDSMEFILSILHSGDSTDLSHENADFPKLLEQYGPALIRIQGFKVEQKFHSSSWQHLGVCSSEIIGKHAMILVGYRREKYETRYLVQNWWKMKPFVEVDASYLRSCRSIVHFVETPQYEMEKFQTNAHDHVECEMLDSPEHFSPEMY